METTIWEQEYSKTKAGIRQREKEVAKNIIARLEKKDREELAASLWQKGADTIISACTEKNTSRQETVSINE